MSEFTTKVRFICETFAGLKKSGGFADIESTIANSHDKIFGDYPIFDEDYRPVLEKEILYQYYDREICSDTVAMWQYYLTKNMKRIMPLYNQYFESELLLKGVNLLNDVDLTTERNVDKTNVSLVDVTGKTTATNEMTTTDESKTEQDFSTTSNLTQNKNATNTNNINNLHWDTHSDTPQGTVSDLDSGIYMSDARKVTDVNTNTTTNTGVDTDESVGSGNNSTDFEGETSSIGSSVADVINNSKTDQTGIEKYLEKISGIRGGSRPEKMLMLRKSFLNINAMIFEELETCFYQFY